MKLSSLVVTSIPLLIIGLALALNTRCHSPQDYQPPEDTLVTPPPEPQLITPENGTLFSLTPGFSTDIYFQWSQVTGAEFYEIEFANDAAFSTNVEQYQVNYHSTTITFTNLGDFFWRVRAYSRHWTWYTGWSDVRSFIISSVL